MKNWLLHGLGVFLLASPSLALAQLPVPTAELTSPAAGSIFHVGDTVKFQWTIHCPYLPSGTLLQLSVDDGLTWYRFSGDMLKATDTNVYHDCVGRFSWVIPDSLKYLNNPKIAITGTCLIDVAMPYNSEIQDGQGEIVVSSTGVRMPYRQASPATRPSSPSLAIGDGRTGEARENLGVFDMRGRQLRANTGLQKVSADRAFGAHVVRMHTSSDR